MQSFLLQDWTTVRGVGSPVVTWSGDYAEREQLS
jgi:hypothetical protein